MKSPVILIADKGKLLHQDFRTKLLLNGFDIIDTPPQINPLQVFRKNQPDLILLSATKNSPENELDFTRQIREQNQRIPIIFMAENSSEDLAIAALKAGVSDFFKPPLSRKELTNSIQQNLSNSQISREENSPRKEIKSKKHHAMVGRSMVMAEVRELLSKVAQSDCTVLITGETGTGKELAARAIHSDSKRNQKPLVSINCAAIPDSLVESELFGYDQGAFTGAIKSKEGLFELATHSTVFLDEIGDMTPFAQAKILRCIELKETSRLGGQAGKPIDFRVIAATNRDPETLIAEKKFRKDLYYRLNVARVHVPPLRDRKEDIPDLVDHFIQKYNQKFRRRIKGFSPKALHTLLRYDWPGNIRELKNLVEVSFINLPARKVDLMGLPRQLGSRLNEMEPLPKTERERIIAALCETKWNKSKAAQRLNWSRMTLYRKIAKYNIALDQDYATTRNEFA